MKHIDNESALTITQRHLARVISSIGSRPAVGGRITSESAQCRSSRFDADSFEMLQLAAIW